MTSTSRSNGSARRVQDLSHLPESAGMSLSVAVTGATGFIGRHLTADLARREASSSEPSCDRESTRNVPSGASVVRAPLEPSALREAFEGVDAVVHLAGVVNALDETDYTAVNVDGTRAVACAAAAAGVASGTHLEPRGCRSGLRRRAALRGRRAEPADAVRPQ